MPVITEKIRASHYNDLVNMYNARLGLSLPLANITDRITSAMWRTIITQVASACAAQNREISLPPISNFDVGKIIKASDIMAFGEPGPAAVNITSGPLNYSLVSESSCPYIGQTIMAPHPEAGEGVRYGFLGLSDNTVRYNIERDPANILKPQPYTPIPGPQKVLIFDESTVPVYENVTGEAKINLSFTNARITTQNDTRKHDKGALRVILYLTRNGNRIAEMQYASYDHPALFRLLDFRWNNIPTSPIPGTPKYFTSLGYGTNITNQMNSTSPVIDICPPGNYTYNVEIHVYVEGRGSGLGTFNKKTPWISFLADSMTLTVK